MLDADVLYPAGLRDLLLRLADRYLFTPLWSADIHAEWMRSLLADRPDLDAAVLERTRSVMDGHFPEAVVTGHRALVGDLDLPDPDDRHVLAAAIEGRADVIVTRNMRDFPADRLAPHALGGRASGRIRGRFAGERSGNGAGGRPRTSRGTAQPAAIGWRAPGRARTSWPTRNGVAAAGPRGRHLTTAPVDGVEWRSAQGVHAA